MLPRVRKHLLTSKTILPRQRNFEGVTGDTSFDKNHNTVKTAFMMTMNNGKVTAAETVKP